MTIEEIRKKLEEGRTLTIKGYEYRLVKIENGKAYLWTLNPIEKLKEDRELYGFTHDKEILLESIERNIENGKAYFK